MAKIHLSDVQKDLVERLGVAHERVGLPPAAARILALLLVSDEFELTFDSIQETLGFSKSSTSNAIAMLLSMRRITYITRHGERRRYFRVSMRDVVDDVNNKFDDMLQLSELLRVVVRHRTSATPEFNQELLYLASFLDFLRAELPRLVQQWKERTSTPSVPPRS